MGDLEDEFCLHVIPREGISATILPVAGRRKTTPHTRWMASSLVLLAALLIPFTVHAADLNAELLRAARAGDTAAVQALIAKGADVNAKVGKKPLDKEDEHAQSYGWTALIVAAQWGHTETVRALLEAGADVNEQALDDGQTALMKAARDAYKDVVNLLIAHGADVNLKTAWGGTALMAVTWASGGGDRTAIVKALLDAGADVNVKDSKGQTALRNAQGNDEAEIIKLLKQAGAKE